MLPQDYVEISRTSSHPLLRQPLLSAEGGPCSRCPEQTAIGGQPGTCVTLQRPLTRDGLLVTHRDLLPPTFVVGGPCGGNSPLTLTEPAACLYEVGLCVSLPQASPPFPHMKRCWWGEPPGTGAPSRGSSEVALAADAAVADRPAAACTRGKKQMWF